MRKEANIARIAYEHRPELGISWLDNSASDGDNYYFCYSKRVERRALEWFNFVFIALFPYDLVRSSKCRRSSVDLNQKNKMSVSSALASMCVELLRAGRSVIKLQPPSHNV